MRVVGNAYRGIVRCAYWPDNLIKRADSLSVRRRNQNRHEKYETDEEEVVEPTECPSLIADSMKQDGCRNPADCEGY